MKVSQEVKTESKEMSDLPDIIMEGDEEDVDGDVGEIAATERACRAAEENDREGGDENEREGGDVRWRRGTDTARAGTSKGKCHSGLFIAPRRPPRAGSVSFGLLYSTQSLCSVV